MAATSREIAGVLMREIPVRLINVSRSGGLIECQRRLDVGAVGRLRLQFGIEENRDDFMVVRCQAIQGAGSIYHVGVRFLWLCHSPTSIRHVVTRHVAKLTEHTRLVM